MVWRRACELLRPWSNTAQTTGLFIGYVPGFPGAHSQGETLDELSLNLSEVIEMLLEEFVDVERVDHPR